MKRLPLKVLPMLVAGAFVMMFAHVVRADTGEGGGKSFLSYVPAGGELVVSVDFETLMALPSVRKAVEDLAGRHMRGLLDELEKYGLELELHEVFRRVVSCIYDMDAFFSRPDPGSVAHLIHTALPEKSFRHVLDEIAAQGEVAYELKNVEGHDVYYLFKVFADTLTVAYIGPEQVLVADESEILNALRRLEAGDTLEASPHLRQARIDSDSLIWVLVEGVNEEVTGADFALNLTGPDSDGVSAHFTIEFADDQLARAMYSGLRGLFDEQTAVLEEMGFGPDLAERMWDEIPLELIGKEVRFRLSLDLAEIIEAWRKAIEPGAPVAVEQSGETE